MLAEVEHLRIKLSNIPPELKHLIVISFLKFKYSFLQFNNDLFLFNQSALVHLMISFAAFPFSFFIGAFVLFKINQYLRTACLVISFFFNLRIRRPRHCGFNEFLLLNV